ncbi:hypothetical protein RND81_06G169700 [Saponaria officinalis]|uniref:Uncharacterized protein n=1 Tax=Saponaria officinalis TaxID=3572 RepID=A0AAW1K7B3_SAPOF
MDKFKGFNSVMKVKRKELDEFNDDFSEFSLASPARKIRRLDVDLPPIVEEEGVDITMKHEQVIPENVILDGVSEQSEHMNMPDIEELPPLVAENDEKAIVLFKPMNTPICYSGTNFSIDPNLIASFKNQALWGMNINAAEPRDKDEDSTNEDHGKPSACRAVIPWVPSQQLNLKPKTPGNQTEVSDAMDAEEPEVTTMEIEDPGQQTSYNYDRYRLTDGLSSEWQQQPHCTFPQPLENITTPVVGCTFSPPLENVTTPVVWYR